jgi:Zn-dependent protease
MENSIAPPPQPEWLPPQPPVPPVAPKPMAAPNEAFGAKHKRAGSGILAGLVALAAKGKALLLLLPKIKFLATAGTALVSIAAYTIFFGWPFAVGLVALLFVHEMGHVIALRREGIPASAPMFIPFLGAVVVAKKLGDDAATEARVGLAGPILGTVGAGVCLAIHQATGSLFWQQLAYFGFFLNLFNLLPVTPLDGGRAMAALAPVMWFVGLGLMIVLALTFTSGLIFIFTLIAGFDVYHRWGALRKGGPATQSYYRVATRDRVMIAATYLGLIAILVAGMDLTFLHRSL